jgi:hypothetical protein
VVVGAVAAAAAVAVVIGAAVVEGAVEGKDLVRAVADEAGVGGAVGADGAGA